MIRSALLRSIVLAVAACCAAPAHAGGLAAWQGHIEFGYSLLAGAAESPPGSIGLLIGVDRPLTGPWRIGPSISYSLLGSTQIVRDDVPAGLDHSMFDGALLLHRTFTRGPLVRLSAGPGLASARAELQVAGGGAGFADDAVGEVRPCAAFEALFAPRTASGVSVGASLGARVVPLESRTWSVWSVRIAISY